MNRPITTLYMLMSLDGKITLGNSDSLDFDKDLPNIDGVKEGLYQYYDIEQTTDLWSLNTGKVQTKIGVNTKPTPNKTIVSFVIIDNKHLDINGLNYFIALSKEFVLVTTNQDHPGFNINADNMHIIYQETLDLNKLLITLKNEYHCDYLTIQSGGTLNSLFLKEGLFDYIDIIVAPVLVGGKDTSSLIDGESFTNVEELNKLGVLELESTKTLHNSYLRLRYKVIHK